MASAETSVDGTKKQDWLVPRHFVAWLVFAAVFFFSDELDRAFHLWLLIIPILVLSGLAAIGTFLVGFAASVWKMQLSAYSRSWALPP